ncbi:MAG: class II aldolase/adducin family protein [Planctomycetota bacterium]|jgi:L-fuculose-phosphate aldolase|nr:class II aldolase/adducin family protein [Planctomycetota bacterium]
MPNYEKMVVEAAKEMARQALTVSTWGNISARDPKSGKIYLTPSGMDYKKCTEDDIVVFDAKGKRVKGMRKPSIEKDMHIYIFQHNPKFNAIIHTHALYSTIMAVAGVELPAITEEFAQTLGELAPVSKYAIPGTPLLGENVSKVIEAGHRAALLPNHGALVVGEDMKIAFRSCGVLEKASEVYVKVKSMGLEPKVIDPADVGHMHRFFTNSYGQK